MISKTNMCRFCLATCIALMSCGCSHAPAIDVMGSLFPAWLLCIALGTLAAILNRWLLLRYRIQLLFPFLAYPCLAAVYTFAIWLVFF
jgi:YtcA family